MDSYEPALPLAYECYGQGPPLLLLHGALVDRAYWQPQRADFAARYRVIACDLPGHGAAPPLSGPTSVAQLARQVLATLTALGLPRVTCVGHSLGGMVAQELALLAPDRVAALVLVDTWYHPPGEPYELFPFRTALMHWWLRATSVADLVGLMARGLARFNPSITPYALRVMERYTAERSSYLHIWDAAMDFSSRDRLHRITCPTLVVASDRFPFTRYQAEIMRHRLPDADLAVIARSGHWVNWDNPADFNQVVLEFIATRGSTRSVDEPQP